MQQSSKNQNEWILKNSQLSFRTLSMLHIVTQRKPHQPLKASALDGKTLFNFTQEQYHHEIRRCDIHSQLLNVIRQQSQQRFVVNVSIIKVFTINVWSERVITVGLAESLFHYPN